MCSYKDVPVNCGPNGLPFARNFLYRNQGDGTFRDVSETQWDPESHLYLRDDLRRSRFYR